MSSACELVVFNLDSEATQECWSWLIKQLRHIASTKWKSVDVKWLLHFRRLPLFIPVVLSKKIHGGP